MSNPGTSYPGLRRPALQEPTPSPNGDFDKGDEISLIGLATAVVRHRRAAFVGAIVVAALVVGLGMMAPRTYSTTASFAPQPRRASGGSTSSLAAQFGIAVSGGDVLQSPQFYVDLLTADEILRDLVDSSFTLSPDAGAKKVNLVDVFAPGQGTKEMRTERTIRSLRRRISASASLKTGVIKFTVSTKSAELSRQIAERILANLNEFNIESRIRQAATERKFIEARMSEAESQLRAAEDRAEEFIQSNLTVGSSARLALERDRLQRDVNMRQQLYTALAMEYDRARNEELRDTPIIAILERPRAAVLPDPRGTVKKAILAALVGAVLGLIVAMLRDYFRDVDDSPSHGAVGEFKAAAREAINDLRHPFRSRGSRQRSAG